MVVRVNATDEAGDGQPVSVGRVVLLAKVPDDCEMVPETGRQLPQVELANVVQGRAAAQLLVILGLLDH